MAQAHACLLVLTVSDRERIPYFAGVASGELSWLVRHFAFDDSRPPVAEGVCPTFSQAGSA
ncbi:hypothetical protein [Lysobacter gummosus]|uniref:hypothetical protein n=1 Tax=Lysobacter gummosus TaxID=262324 RepID=UPI003631135B